ncbi:MAG: hypothetical protein ACLP01_20880 [Solirubrobacteraceae bacterium]
MLRLSKHSHGSIDLKHGFDVVAFGASRQSRDPRSAGACNGALDAKTAGGMIAIPPLLAGSGGLSKHEARTCDSIWAGRGPIELTLASDVDSRAAIAFAFSPGR